MAELQIGRFSKKGTQLQNILIALLNDEKFVKLVQSPTRFPLDTIFDVTFDPYSLLNTKLYTQVYQPPTDTKVVNVDVYYTKGGIGNGNTYYKNADLSVSIIVHRDLWEIDGGLRAFEIADRVDYILNRNDVTSSLSSDWFKNFKYYPVNNDYNVLELVYSNWN